MATGQLGTWVLGSWPLGVLSNPNVISGPREREKKVKSAAMNEKKKKTKKKQSRLRPTFVTLTFVAAGR